MDRSKYSEIDNLIKEYEEDSKTFRSKRLVMQNYPKIFVMSAASLFELNIKKCCKDFLDYLKKNNQELKYPVIIKILKNQKIRSKIDNMFAKLKGGYGAEQLDATQFYDLFGGNDFQKEVEFNFNINKSNELNFITQKINGLQNLGEQEEKYIYDYIKQCEIKDELDKCTFKDAEEAYLSLKYKRNIVAHNYINGLSDTFEDLQKFYIKAVIYVVSLEKAIMDLTI